MHLVGAGGIDGQGLAGVEGSFDALLAQGGLPLELTLDVRLQHILKREISVAMKEFKGKAGAGLIMDVETGEVLAAVSLPDYNPQGFQKAQEDKKFNRFSQGVYELGSVFKVFSTAAMLEKTKSRMSQRFDVREPLQIGRYKIRDYHSKKRILSCSLKFLFIPLILVQL